MIMEDEKETLTSAFKSDVSNFTFYIALTPQGWCENVSSKLEYNKNTGNTATFILIS